MKIRKNDNVSVIAGKDRGKTGVVERVFLADDKIVVTGIAVYKKSVKPTRRAPKGGIIEVNAKIPVSNVAIICPSCSKITKIGYSVSGDLPALPAGRQAVRHGKKIRICKKCKASLEVEKK
ncbi:MAG: 50S ribosomal protein L24 [Candidatus Berkelbacteria bacterium]|nr:50S ribosomal protein L24 [Candidatus Berkelbacteria bacterium]